MVMPGDSAELTVELDASIALEVESRFAIRECNRTVGAGVGAASSTDVSGGDPRTCWSPRRRARRGTTSTLRQS